MDFSTIDRALLSLSRREPPLPDELLDLSNSLSALTTTSPHYVSNDDYIAGILRLVSTSERWEPLAVGLCLAIDCIERHTANLHQDNTPRGVYADGPRIPEMMSSKLVGMAPPSITDDSPILPLLTVVPSVIHAHIEHREPRVRSLIAKTVGAYACIVTGLRASRHDNFPIAELQVKRREVHDAILKSLKFHLEMKVRETAEVMAVNEEPVSKASDGALDDTTGWRALETNLHALAGYIDGNCVSTMDDDGGTPFSYLSEQACLFEENHWFLQGLQYASITHVNRHVRAASSAVLGTLVKTCMKSRTYDLLLDSPLRSVIQESLKANLADNWSQVRMSGSVLCRQFVEALLTIYKDQNVGDEDKDITIFEASVGDMVTMLLPRMCLNRFYLAQGVKLYSQDTWKLVFGGNVEQGDGSVQEEGLHSSEHSRGGGGMGAVARNAAPLCRYYSKMCDADNHAVREVSKASRIMYPCILLIQLTSHFCSIFHRLPVKVLLS